MRYKLSLLGICLVLAMSLHAQSITQMFQTMPDTIMPYFSPETKKNMVNPVVLNPQKEISCNTIFNTMATFLLESPSRMRISIDSTSVIDIVLLPTTLKQDSICCFIRTMPLPQHESEITFYNKNWQLIGVQNLKSTDIKETVNQYTCCPDTMSEKRYKELLSGISFIAIEATLTSDTEIVLTPSVPLIFKDEEKELKDILLQKKAKWNGEIFK